MWIEVYSTGHDLNDLKYIMIMTWLSRHDIVIAGPRP